MIDYNFTPPRITVEAGSKVTFTNSGSQPHNAAGADAGGIEISAERKSGPNGPDPRYHHLKPFQFKRSHSGNPKGRPIRQALR
jgi:plastocyanin